MDPENIIVILLFRKIKMFGICQDFKKINIIWIILKNFKNEREKKDIQIDHKKDIYMPQMQFRS